MSTKPHHKAQSTDALIAALEGAGPRRALAGAEWLTAGWMVAASVWVAGFLAIVGVRPDIVAKVRNPFFGAELALLIALAVYSALAALTLSRPDEEGARTRKYLPFVFLAFWAPVAWLGSDGAAHWEAVCDAAAGMALHCPLHILALSAPLAAGAFALVRLGACTRPLTAGVMGTLAATAMAYLAMRLAEPTDALAHLLLWHAAPAAAICAIGAAAGCVALRWR
jgi:hypothetical protein